MTSLASSVVLHCRPLVLALVFALAIVLESGIEGASATSADEDEGGKEDVYLNQRA